MKTLYFALPAVALACSSAGAQTAPPDAARPPTSSVTLYGSLDVGLTYVDDIAGQSRRFVGSGSKLANRLGFRGREDLGGGLSALFTLESGLNVDDGTTTLGGRMWGRQSFVGLGSRTWGTLTFGRQYDFLYAGSPMPLDMGALLIGGLAGATGGAGTSVDNRLGGVRSDNTVKWVGQHEAWTLGAMYGLGTENGQDKMASAVLAYRTKSLWLGATYLRDNYSAAASGNRISAASANYNVTDATRLVLSLSLAKADTATDKNSRNEMVQGGVLHKLDDTWDVGAMFGNSEIRNAADAPGKLRQWGLGFACNLSRRTELYGIFSQVRSSGSAGTAYSSTPGLGAPAASFRSSDDSQNVVKAGIRHSF